MKTQSPDTHPEAERVLIEGCRRLTVAQKLAIVSAMCSAARQLQTSDTLRRHPDASPEEIRLRVGSRWIAPDLMRRAYQWDPDEHGY